MYIFLKTTGSAQLQNEYRLASEVTPVIQMSLFVLTVTIRIGIGVHLCSCDVTDMGCLILFMP